MSSTTLSSQLTTRSLSILNQFSNTKLVGKEVLSLDENEKNINKKDENNENSNNNNNNNSDEDSDISLPIESNEMFTDYELMNTHTPLLYGDDINTKREEIRNYFHQTFSLYERLFDLLSNDSTFYMQPEKLRHPLIFYFGHTAVFFINKLRLSGLLTTRINEIMESTLAIGVDEMSWDDLNIGNYNWPSVNSVREYRDKTRILVDDLITTLPLTLPITWESPFWIILMGCEHERIHLETSSVLFRQLDISQIKPIPMWDYCKEFKLNLLEIPKNFFINVPEGIIKSGINKENQKYYSWDNEYGSITTKIDSFDASSYLCSNGEFYEFVLAGGYNDESLWGEEGWRFVTFRQATCPVFWVKQEPNESGIVTYKYRTMTAIIDMPWDWPVDVNYIESKAFCTWKNRLLGKRDDNKIIRLPTEEEYKQLREFAYPEFEKTENNLNEFIQNDQPYWQSKAPGNINMEYFASSTPINKFKFKNEFHDIIGNVWQWSETPIMPYRGFQFHPAYDDFSVPTFDTRHNIFCGGSWASTGNESTRSARYAFRRHFYQHAGFRYILAKPLPISNNNEINNTMMCESDPSVTYLMDAQYNDEANKKIISGFGMKSLINYSQRIAEISINLYKLYGKTESRSIVKNSSSTYNNNNNINETTSLSSLGPRCVDFGCGPGRLTFEIAKLSSSSNTNTATDDNTTNEPLFDHILGLDLSTRFIRIGAQLQFENHAEYNMKKEGEITSYHSIEFKSKQEIEENKIKNNNNNNTTTTTTVDSSSSSSSLSSALSASISSTPSIFDFDFKTNNMLNRIEFMQGDVCNLGIKFNGFDLCLAINLLEFLYSPRLFLEIVSNRIRSGGIFIIVSSYQWDKIYTPKEQWLGGYKDTCGENVDSEKTIKEILINNKFESIQLNNKEDKEILMIMKNSQRDMTIRIGQLTAWRKK